MNEFWANTGLLWEQIGKAVYNCNSMVVISKEGISVNGERVSEFYARGILTVDQLEDVLQRCYKGKR